jgi:transposase
MERTAMSARESRRAAVMARVVAGDVPLRDAAVMLDISYRQAKRLRQRYRGGGAGALVWS